MKKRNHYRWYAILMLAIAAVPNTSSAQEDDTLSISGAFHMDSISQGEVGVDLLEIFGDGDDYGWTLTLYGVTYSHHFYSYEKRWITRVYATSFDFEFVGPEADILNEIVSEQFTRGALTDCAFLEMWNGDTYYDLYGDFIYSDTYGGWSLGLASEPGPGVGFGCWGFSADYGPFRTDEDGYPEFEPQSVFAGSTLYDNRVSGNSGWVESLGDVVDFGSSEPPLPPPPPPPPALSIADGSVSEGNKGTTTLNLTVTLSRSSTEAVTVKYATLDGTALAKQDYTATSGTLTFQPGKTSGTISVAIAVDRKRESNETFWVQLSNASGATIADGVATATIVNDD